MLPFQPSLYIKCIDLLTNKTFFVGSFQNLVCTVHLQHICLGPKGFLGHGTCSAKTWTVPSKRGQLVTVVSQLGRATFQALYSHMWPVATVSDSTALFRCSVDNKVS